MIPRRRQSISQDNTPRPSSPDQVFKAQVQHFLVETVQMVRMSIQQNSSALVAMIQLLQKQLGKHTQRERASSRQKIGQAIPPKNVTGNGSRSNLSGQVGGTGQDQKMTIASLQQQVKLLIAQSDILSQKLFDLGQGLISKHSQQLKTATDRIRHSYEQQLQIEMNNISQQRNTFTITLQKQKAKIKQLQDILATADEYFMKRQKDRLEQFKKQQLSKYLQVIEDIYREIELLKNIQVRKEAYQVVQIEQQRPQRYSQQYYNIKTQDHSTVVSHQPCIVSQNHQPVGQPCMVSHQPCMVSHQPCMVSHQPCNYCTPHYEYYPSTKLPSYQQRYTPMRQVSQPRQIITIDQRSPRHKQCEPTYIPVSPSRPSYYIRAQNDVTSRSRQKVRQKSIDRQQPIILHFSDQSKQNYTQPRQNYVQTGHKRNKDLEMMQERNGRLENVQKTMQGLKWQLKRQLYTLKSKS